MGALPCRPLNAGTILGRGGLDLVVSEWRVEVESEELGFFADDGRGDNVEDVVVGLLRDVVLLEQLPEVSLSRIVGHVSKAPPDVIRPPVVGGHHEKSRRLSISRVDVMEIVKQVLTLLVLMLLLKQI